MLDDDEFVALVFVDADYVDVDVGDDGIGMLLLVLLLYYLVG